MRSVMAMAAIASGDHQFNGTHTVAFVLYEYMTAFDCQSVPSTRPRVGAVVTFAIMFKAHPPFSYLYGMFAYICCEPSANRVPAGSPVAAVTVSMRLLRV